MSIRRQLAEIFLNEQKIDQETYHRILEYETGKKFSLHWELRIILYLGISLFTGGLGVFIYNNIGSAGHVALIFLLFASCAACFVYAFKHALPFSLKVQEHNNPFFDYAVLLGSLLFIIAEGYLQFRFNAFGNYLSWPTLFTSLLLFGVACFFDHKGVLSIAITTLAAFFGMVITPRGMLEQMVSSGANGIHYLLMSLAFAVILFLVALVIEKFDVKAHFTFTFMLFSCLTAELALATATMSLEPEGLYFLLLCVVAALFFWQARRHDSFLILLITVLIMYIAISYMVLTTADFGVTGVLVYFIISCIGVIQLLRNHKSLLGTNDDQVSY